MSIHKPVFDAELNVWFVSRFDERGKCQGSVAHVDNKATAIRICASLNQ